MPIYKPRMGEPNVSATRLGAANLPALVLLILWLLVASPVLAATPAAPSDDGAICDQVASIAAADSAVPLSVLRAVSRTETGRARNGRIEPWPWTVNMEGAGHWFDTQDAARAYVFQHFKAGARSFDVGCFQINYKWHHQAFKSLDDMFDPVKNARYAARFLQDLYDELGSWESAVGAYHSRTEALANKYLSRYRRIHANLSDPGNLPTSSPVQRVAQRAIPFLPRHQPATSGAAQLGSLMSAPASATSSLINTTRKPLVSQ